MVGLGCSAKSTMRKGTTVTKEYQRKKPGAGDALELVVPDRVSVVMADVAEDMREGLLALAVGAGLQVMSALMEADVTALTGPR
ncbi:MAG TPA: IS256 family transposase, partial [Candidatus Dormibacteraeota bacterium]